MGLRLLDRARLRLRGLEHILLTNCYLLVEMACGVVAAAWPRSPIYQLVNAGTCAWARISSSGTAPGARRQAAPATPKRVLLPLVVAFSAPHLF